MMGFWRVMRPAATGLMDWVVLAMVMAALLGAALMAVDPLQVASLQAGAAFVG